MDTNATPVVTDPLAQIQLELRAGRIEQAEALARDFLRGTPRDPAGSYLLGLILSRTGRLEEAEHHLRTPAELPDAMRDCLCEYGRLLCEMGKFARGIEYLRLATQADMGSAFTWEHLAAALLRAGQFVDAVNASEESVRCRERSGGGGVHAMLHAGRAWASMAEAGEAVKWHARALHEHPGNVAAAAGWATLLNYLDVGPGDLSVAVTRVNEAVRQASGEAAARPRMTWKPGSRALRVGLLTPDLREHPVGRRLLPLLASADPTRIQWHVYHAHSQLDDLSKRCERHVAKWTNVAHLSDHGIAECLRADGIDVLIDVAGWHVGSRITVLASRPAPLQLTYLGYPSTTGAPGVDARLVDEMIEPRAVSPAAWTPGLQETPVAIDGCSWCWMPPAEQVPCRRLGRGPITFGSFNSAGKISPRCGRVWAKVLASVPFSRLVIKGQGLSDRSTRDTALRALVRHGIEPARVDLRGLCPSSSEHLAMHNQIDVMLDPFPYNGVTTTCEALWMGVPVVTLEGSREGGRIGASIMRVVGLESNIARDEAAYVTRAATLAAEVKTRSASRDELRDRMLASSVCDSASFAGRFTDAIEKLAERCIIEGL